MPMKFVVVINEGPYQHQASDSAYAFARAALGKDHELLRVFFYHDGVYNGTSLSVPPQDEHHVVDRWRSLAQRYGIDLAICVAAGQRRGVMDAAESARHQLDSGNLASGFRIAGLGQLLDACIEADRVLVFGD